MKHRLLDILKCPECGCFPLGLEIFEGEAIEFDDNIDETRCKNVCSYENSGHSKDCAACYREEIAEGVMICRRCEQCYPIVNGVPRFNPDWDTDFPEFLAKYKENFLKKISNEKMLRGLKEFEKSHGATKKSFGFQWLKYAVTDKTEDIQDFFSKVGVTPDFLRGKLILDAGCGMGRFLLVASRNDNEVVGIDLSMSVERAYKVTKRLPFVHVVQGDILKPPFITNIFSFIYSIGVLHHTPNTKESFKSVSKLAAKGARMSIWVYQLWVSPELKEKHKRVFSKIQEGIFCTLRSITTRLPHKLLHYLCYIAVPLGWAQMKIRKSSALKLLFWPFLLLYVRGHDEWEIRLLDTFDWYSPKYQWKHTYDEVFSWFGEEGFSRIEKTASLPIGVTAVKS